MFFDRSLYEREIFFDGIVVGHAFPPYKYQLGRELLDAYMESVDESHPAFRSENAARRLGFEHVPVPPLAVLIYGFAYTAMGRRLATGNLNSAIDFEFHSPVRPDATLTMNLTVDDKYIKREKKYVVLKAVVSDEVGQPVSTGRLTFMVPK